MIFFKIVSSFYFYTIFEFGWTKSSRNFLECVCCVFFFIVYLFFLIVGLLMWMDSMPHSKKWEMRVRKTIIGHSLNIHRSLHKMLYTRYSSMGRKIQCLCFTRCEYQNNWNFVVPKYGCVCLNKWETTLFRLYANCAISR